MRKNKIGLTLGEKAYKLYQELAKDSNIGLQYMLTRILLREARATVASLPSDKLQERLELIDGVEDELSESMYRPPIRHSNQQLAEQSKDPRKNYQKIWEAHRRLRKRGLTEAEIHQYCIQHYGEDIKVAPTPSKRPQNTGRGGWEKGKPRVDQKK